METVYLQIVFLFCLAVIPGVAIVAPVLFLRWRFEFARRTEEFNEDGKFSPKIAIIFNLANSFACGVFLAVCFLSLLPASNARWSMLLKNPKSVHEMIAPSNQNNFPISELIVLMGFTLMFCLDKICSEKWERCSVPEVSVTAASTPTPTDQHKDDNFSDIPTSSNCSENEFIDPFLLHQAESNSCDTIHHENTQRVEEGSCNHYISLKEIRENNRLKMESPQSFSSDYGSIENSDGNGSLLSRNRKRANLIFNKKWNSSHQLLQSIGGLNVCLFLATMAWHNLLEGLSLGIQTDKDAAVSLFLGILIHSILLSIAISLSALKAWQPPAKMSFNRAAIFLIILVLFRPTGILLGLALGTSSGYGGHFITAMLQSLSAGIFIHVTFFSLLPGEFGKPGESSCHVAGAAGNGASRPTLFWKLTLLVSGWTSLSVIMLLVKHSH